MRSDLTPRITESPQPKASGTSVDSWDATKTEAPAELRQNSFQLAYFLFPDRSAAMEIVVRALQKIRLRSRREIKRLYWRDKHAERPVRRIARSDVDMLQWLIMFESEEDERTQERTGNPSTSSMAIRYIKHLVQISTALSSFYVNVGMTRLLHNYSTSEAQRVYEMLTCRFLGPDEYRRAKAALMDKMSQRFAGFVKITRVEHGELRFEALDYQERWAGLVDECLRAFTPWSTQGSCPQYVTNHGGKTKLRTDYGAGDTDRNELEMRCCHLLIEPACYTRLLEDLTFDPPDTKLDLPRFVMPEKKENSGDNGIQSRPTPGLSQEELDEIQRRLAETDARRRNLDPRLLTVVIDGVEHSRLDLAQKNQLQIEVQAGASLIEIRGEDDRGALVLATHIIPYSDNAFEFSSGTAMLGNGKLKFAVTPIANLADAPARAMLSLNYHPKLQFTRPRAAWRIFWNSRQAIRSYALAGLTMALIGWGVADAFYGYKIKLLEQKLQQARSNQPPLMPTAASAIISYRLARDDQRVRGVEAAGIPQISLRFHSPAVSLELPVSGTTDARSYSAELTTFTGDQTLLTQNFLQVRRADADSIVEIMLPSDLLKPDSYYTVYLHSSDTTHRFTFKVVADQ